MPRTLWDIQQELLDAVNVEDVNGELDAKAEAYLASLGEEEAVKLDGYINAIRMLDMEANAAKAEAKSYIELADERLTRIDHLKARLKDHLVKTGRDRVTTATGRTIRIQANGGVVPLIRDDLVDLSHLPEDCVKIERKADESRIREYLALGLPIPHYSLGVRGTHIRI